jgi:hypothetical protein
MRTQDYPKFYPGFPIGHVLSSAQIRPFSGINRVSLIRWVFILQLVFNPGHLFGMSASCLLLPFEYSEDVNILIRYSTTVRWATAIDDCDGPLAAALHVLTGDRLSTAEYLYAAAYFT